VKNVDFLRRVLVRVGDFSLFVRQTFRAFGKLWYRRNLFLRQCETIGVNSTGIIIVSALFFGAVLGYQMYIGFAWFGFEELLGGSVGVSLFRDMAPTMSSFMVTGRAGAAIAAELATMRISEQIDALEVMAVDPMEFLVAPRVASGFIMMPILAVFFSAVASLAAAGISCGIMGLSYAIFWEQYIKFVDAMDLVHCITKGATYGLVITWVGSYFGFRAQGGARAVGLATRTTVVMATLGILLSDYIITTLLPVGDSRLHAG